MIKEEKKKKTKKTVNIFMIRFLMKIDMTFICSHVVLLMVHLQLQEELFVGEFGNDVCRYNELRYLTFPHFMCFTHN